MEGLTGLIQFDNQGFRSQFTLDVMHLQEGGLINVGTWNTTSGLLININTPTTSISEIDDGTLKNVSFTIITALVHEIYNI